MGHFCHILSSDATLESISQWMSDDEDLSHTLLSFDFDQTIKSLSKGEDGKIKIGVRGGDRSIQFLREAFHKGAKMCIVTAGDRVEFSYSKFHLNFFVSFSPTQCRKCKNNSEGVETAGS